VLILLRILVLVQLRLCVLRRCGMTVLLLGLM
jgi:hypothetical protein